MEFRCERTGAEVLRAHARSRMCCLLSLPHMQIRWHPNTFCLPRPVLDLVAAAASSPNMHIAPIFFPPPSSLLPRIRSHAPFCFALLHPLQGVSLCGQSGCCACCSQYVTASPIVGRGRGIGEAGCQHLFHFIHTMGSRGPVPITYRSTPSACRGQGVVWRGMRNTVWVTDWRATGAEEGLLGQFAPYCQRMEGGVSHGEEEIVNR